MLRLTKVVNVRKYYAFLTDAILEEERLLKQKAKIQWLKEGDNNNAYFHRVIQGRQNRNRIESIVDDNGNRQEGKEVADLFVSHYKKFIGQAEKVAPI